MLSRIAVAAVMAGILTVGGTSGARAQQPTSMWQPAAATSGWSFEVTPYVWFASINTNINFDLPPALGGTVSASPSIGFGELISHTNLAFMGTAEVRYDKFTLLTDIVWLNVGGIASRFKSITFTNHPAIPITAAANDSQGLKVNTEIWTLAGGYTVLQGPWGNVDLLAGFRLAAMSSRMNYSLGIAIAGPLGNGATFGGIGGVSTSGSWMNGIAGVRGSIRIADTGFFVPYYFDIGTGASNLTWQISSGVGYHTRLADVSLTYRYLSFSQSSSIQDLSIKGPLLAATFRF